MLLCVYDRKRERDHRAVEVFVRACVHMSVSGPWEQGQDCGSNRAKVKMSLVNDPATITSAPCSMWLHAASCLPNQVGKC